MGFETFEGTKLQHSMFQKVMLQKKSETLKFHLSWWKLKFPILGKVNPGRIQIQRIHYNLKSSILSP